MKQGIILISILIFWGCSEDTQTNDDYSLIGTWNVDEWLICSSYINEDCGGCMNFLDNCEYDSCEMTFYISENYYYYELCQYANANPSECENIPGVEWNYETNLCQGCNTLPAQEIISLNQQTICLYTHPECENETACLPIEFSNEGNSASLILIRNEYECEDTDGCTNGFSEQECIDEGYNWESPGCQSISLTK